MATRKAETPTSWVGVELLFLAPWGGVKHRHKDVQVGAQFFANKYVIRSDVAQVSRAGDGFCN